MELIKDGQIISLDNESHISAFLGSGWAEAKASAASIPEEVVADTLDPATEETVETEAPEEAPKVEEIKKPGRKKKQEN